MFMIKENKGIQYEHVHMILLSFLFYLDKKFHSTSSGISHIVLSLDLKAKQLEWNLYFQMKSDLQGGSCQSVSVPCIGKGSSE